jgi:D-alanyl-D-alanine dipeptidase
MLSRKTINSVIVEENSEPMIYMGNIPNLYFDGAMLEENKFCRQSVAEKLIAAQQELPNGLFFKIYFGFRSLEQQLEQWNKRFQETKLEYPNVSLQEQERLTRLKVADARNGKYGPHQTGGAIDITLCNSDGTELDMGTKYPEFTNKTRTYPLQYKKFLGLKYDKKMLLSKNEFRNRELLYDVMVSAGFVNYPGEWWHYCYGDRMWAAYTGKQKCIYGCVIGKIKFLR